MDKQETAQELNDKQLEGLAGGGAAGGPICPKCGSTNVQFDSQKHIVYKCNKCGWKRK